MKVRRKAIGYCLYYGILPWWIYEKKKHYRCSYIYHLCINASMAWRWITFTETENDIDFEKMVNKNY